MIISNQTYIMKKILLILCSIVYFNSLVAQDALNIALDYIHENRSSTKLTNTDIKDLLVVNDYVSKHNAVNHLYLLQQHEGIKVYNAISTFNISKAQKVVGFGNRFVSNVKNKINTKVANISAIEAVEKAAQQLNINFNKSLSVLSSDNAANKKTIIDKADLSTENITAELVFHVVNESELRLAWNILINTTDLQNIWSVRVDAQTGVILNRYNRVLKCNFGPEEHELGLCANKFHNTTKITNNNATNANIALSTKYDYNVYPVPVESPNHGERQIVNSPWLDHNEASPIGWHRISEGQEYDLTRGNNVWAKEDRDGNNAGGYSPQNEDFEFDYPLDFNRAPSQNQDPAITNLFYWNNMVHDVWYQYGFDEVSGNYQFNNFNKGGESGDFVNAEAQDGSGLNNANFSVTPDGTPGRMQMFEWTNPDAGAAVLEAQSGEQPLGEFNFGSASFGVGVTGSIEGDLVLVSDGTNQPTLACSPIINGDEVNGNIALIDRGICNFVDKVEHAEEVGAIAVVMINNEVGGGPMEMGTPFDFNGDINIPTIAIGYTNGNLIKNALEDGEVSLVIYEPINIDGDFDNGVIAHEYGHGISTRLCGGPANANCLSSGEQMGEGWSDWIGLMMTMTPEHTRTTNRGYGTYALGQNKNGRGFRLAQYNTNFAVNGYTYSGSNYPDPATGQPDLFVHNVGFIWGTVLWEMTWDLIDKYGFDADLISGTGGNNIAMQLVIDGLKLQPCNPGMVDGRDGILLADQLNNGGANQELIWTAFTRRGLGVNANQGSPTSHNDQLQNFDLPDEYANVRIELIASSDSVVINENIDYTLRVENKRDSIVNDIEIKIAIPEFTTLDESNLNVDYELVEGSFNINIASLENDAVLEIPFTLTSNHTEFTRVLFSDNIENGTDNWEITNGAGNADWVTVEDGNNGTTAWFAENVGPKSEQLLTLKDFVELERNNDLILSFWHKFRTENTYDGGVIEYAKDDNPFFTIKENQFIQNPYNNTIANQSTAAISGDPAYSGVQYFYKQTIVNLNSYADSDFKVRFKFSSDIGTGQDGWYIDDVKILDAVMLKLNACMVVEGQDDICLEHNAIVNKGNFECIANAGDLQVSVETEEGLIEKGLGEELLVEVTADYGGNVPDEFYESVFIATKKDDDFTIVELAEASTFDFTNYSLGRFIIWNLSYSLFNDKNSIAKFMEDYKVESIQDIVDAAEDDGLCLALNNQNADGEILELRVALPQAPNTGIEELGFVQNVSIAPNPVTDELNLSFEVSERALLQISIFDTKGQLIKQIAQDALPGINALQINTNALAAGAYILSIDGKQFSKTVKFVKD